MKVWGNKTLQKCIAASLLVGSFVFTGVGVTQAESIPQIDNNPNRYVWVASDATYSEYIDATQISARNDASEAQIGVKVFLVDREQQAVFKHNQVYKYDNTKVASGDSGISVYLILAQVFEADGFEGVYTNAPELDVVYTVPEGTDEYKIAQATYQRAYGKPYTPKR